MPDEDTPPSLREQTAALGKMLTAISDVEPSGTPGGTAGAAFLSWIREAGPASSAPHYFTDVAENFRPQEHENRDLTYLFDMLEAYVDMGDEDESDPDPPKTFIGLPLIGE